MKLSLKGKESVLIVRNLDTSRTLASSYMKGESSQLSSGTKRTTL